VDQEAHPETTRIMNRDSGSRSNPQSARKSPTRSRGRAITSSVGCPPATQGAGSRPTTEPKEREPHAAAGDGADGPLAHPAGRTKPLTRNPSSGQAEGNQPTSSACLHPLHEAVLPLQQIQLGHVHCLAVPVDGDDDGQPHGHLSCRHHHDEKRRLSGAPSEFRNRAKARKVRFTASASARWT